MTQPANIRRRLLTKVPEGWLQVIRNPEPTPAMNRGVSVVLVGRKMPMVPKCVRAISNRSRKLIRGLGGGEPSEADSGSRPRVFLFSLSPAPAAGAGKIRRSTGTGTKHTVWSRLPTHAREIFGPQRPPHGHTQRQERREVGEKIARSLDPGDQSGSGVPPTRKCRYFSRPGEPRPPLPLIPSNVAETIRTSPRLRGGRPRVAQSDERM